MLKQISVWALNLTVVLLAILFDWPVVVLLLFVLADLFAACLLLVSVFVRRLVTGDDVLSIVDITDYGVPIDEPSHGSNPMFDAFVLGLSLILPFIVSLFFFLLYASEGGGFALLGATLLFTITKTVLRVSFSDHQALRRQAAFESRYFAPFTFVFLFVIGAFPWPIIGFVIYVLVDSLRGWYAPQKRAQSSP